MRHFNLLSAFFSPGSGHFNVGRHWRGLAWIALLLGSAMTSLWLGYLPFFVVFLAQIVDCALVEEGDPQSTGLQLLWPVVCWAVLFVGAVLLRAVVVETFKIPSGSMSPTLLVGDHVSVSKWPFRPQRGQVIVFQFPKDPDKDFIKRAIAVGGDTVEMRDDVLIINGRPVARQHVDEPCEYDDYREETGAWEKRDCEAWDETLDGRTYRTVYDVRREPRSTPPVTIPEGHTWVLGDNRDNSHDSRFWGTVPPELLRGVPRLIWWSMGHDEVRWSRNPSADPVAVPPTS